MSKKEPGKNPPQKINSKKSRDFNLQPEHSIVICILLLPRSASNAQLITSDLYKTPSSPDTVLSKGSSLN